MGGPEEPATGRWSSPATRRRRARPGAARRAARSRSGTSRECPRATTRSPCTAAPTPYTRFPPAPAPAQKPTGGLHSLTVSNDGTPAYFALLTGGFAVVDTSEFADRRRRSRSRGRSRSTSRRPVWPGPRRAQRDQAVGQRLGLGHRRGLRNRDRGRPRLPVGLGADGRHLRPGDADGRGRVPRARERPGDLRQRGTRRGPRTRRTTRRSRRTSRSSPGTRAAFRPSSIADPRASVPAGRVHPRAARLGDARGSGLSSDPDTGRNEKVVMWSYPVIQDGLIYVVDLRNGLYVLKYRGTIRRRSGGSGSWRATRTRATRCATSRSGGAALL